MTQITPINDEFRVKVYSLSLENSQICDLSNTFLMYPYTIERTAGGECEFVYKVHDGGTTLRDFINNLYTSKKCSSFQKNSNPLDLLIGMVDLYDQLIAYNKITNQSFINPDLIWITKNLRIKMVYTWDMELITDRNLKLYWSPELFGKHIQMNYNQPSSNSCVYSLRLVFYFMITGDDPFDGDRHHVYDRPDMIMMNPIYARLIWSATCSDLKQRPTTKEWREMIVKEMNPPKNSCVLL